MPTRYNGHIPTIEVNGTRLDGVIDIAIEQPIDTVYTMFSATPYTYRQGPVEVTITGVLTDDMQIRLNELWRSPGITRYEVQQDYDGQATYHLEFTPQDITRTVDANGATVYAATLPGHRPAVWPPTFNVQIGNGLPPTRQLSDAQKRAEKLLRRHLTPYQRRQWKKYRAITVRVSNPDTGQSERYQISESGVKQIELRGKVQLASYCIIPNVEYDVAPADKVLARLLLLRTDYKRFMKTANKLGGRRQADPGLYNLAAFY